MEKRRDAIGLCQARVIAQGAVALAWQRLVQILSGHRATHPRLAWCNSGLWNSNTGHGTNPLLTQWPFPRSCGEWIARFLPERCALGVFPALSGGTPCTPLVMGPRDRWWLTALHGTCDLYGTGQALRAPGWPIQLMPDGRGMQFSVPEYSSGTALQRVKNIAYSHVFAACEELPLSLHF